eukprot:13629189-Alexandrium_andersonii.AAC.1
MATEGTSACSFQRGRVRGLARREHLLAGVVDGNLGAASEDRADPVWGCSAAWRSSRLGLWG